VEEFKSMVMAPYAAMGDALFWGGIRPLAAVIALFFAAKGSLWAPVVFLAIFNLPHLWFRIFGLLRGYRLELAVVEGIRKYHLPDIAVRCKEGTVILLGGFSAYLVFLCLQKESMSALLGLLLLPAVVLCTRLVRKGLSSQLLVLLIAAIVIVFVQMG
jgi:PTS system mannose-specific IID component